MKATVQYIHVVLFISLCEVVLTLECVGEILWRDHSNKLKLLSSNFLRCVCQSNV